MAKKDSGRALQGAEKVKQVGGLIFQAMADRAQLNDFLGRCCALTVAQVTAVFELEEAHQAAIAAAKAAEGKTTPKKQSARNVPETKEAASSPRTPVATWLSADDFFSKVTLPTAVAKNPSWRVQALCRLVLTNFCRAIRLGLKMPNEKAVTWDFFARKLDSLLPPTWEGEPEPLWDAFLALEAEALADMFVPDDDLLLRGVWQFTGKMSDSESSLNLCVNQYQVAQPVLCAGSLEQPLLYDAYALGGDIMLVLNGDIPALAGQREMLQARMAQVFAARGRSLGGSDRQVLVPLEDQTRYISVSPLYSPTVHKAVLAQGSDCDGIRIASGAGGQQPQNISAYFTKAAGNAYFFDLNAVSTDSRYLSRLIHSGFAFSLEKENVGKKWAVLKPGAERLSYLRGLVRRLLEQYLEAIDLLQAAPVSQLLDRAGVANEDAFWEQLEGRTEDYALARAAKKQPLTPGQVERLAQLAWLTVSAQAGEVYIPAAEWFKREFQSRLAGAVLVGLSTKE